MIAVIQRVKKASVSIPKQTNSIKSGFLILLGVSQDDNEQDATVLAEKTVKLRIMADKNDKMNLSLSDANAETLVISQFTLLGDASKGNRPSFIKAAAPDKAENLYNLYIDTLKKSDLPVKTGFFGAYMDVKLINDGPTTIILDSQKLKK